MKVCVLGIGSPSGDDQAGWLVVDALLAEGVQPDAHVRIEKLDRPGASLLAQMDDVAWLILVDAMQGGGEAGHVRHFDRHDWLHYGQGLSSHGFGVLDALALAQALDRLPPRIDLYGIELATLQPVSEASAVIHAATRRLAHRIATQLKQAAQAL